MYLWVVVQRNKTQQNVTNESAGDLLPNTGLGASRPPQESRQAFFLFHPVLWTGQVIYNFMTFQERIFPFEGLNIQAGIFRLQRQLRCSVNLKKTNMKVPSEKFIKI